MQQRTVCQDRSTEEARQEVLRLADEEAKRVLEAARVWAELLEVQAVQKAEAT